MKPDKTQSIKKWINNMGFKLSQSHLVNRRSKKINYYTLDNFGVYEEITSAKNFKESGSEKKEQKFFSWNPWGIEFEVNSVRDLSRAYAEFLKYNPDVAVN